MWWLPVTVTSPPGDQPIKRKGLLWPPVWKASAVVRRLCGLGDSSGEAQHGGDTRQGDCSPCGRDAKRSGRDQDPTVPFSGMLPWTEALPLVRGSTISQ